IHIGPPLLSPLFPYTTLFRSPMLRGAEPCFWYDLMVGCSEFDIFNAVKKEMMLVCEKAWYGEPSEQHDLDDFIQRVDQLGNYTRSEEHTSELQSRFDLVCRLL